MSYQDKAELIKFLEESNTDQLSSEFLYEKINFLMTNQTVSVSLRYPGQFVYRAIKYSEKPQNTSQIIYPPKSVAKLNRANLIEEQMFYCSSLKKAPFYELALLPGDRAVLTSWIFNKQFLFAHIGYTKLNLSELGTNRDIPFDVPHILNPDQEIENDLVANYLSRAFCKEILHGQEHYYKLTNAISKQFFSIDVLTLKSNYRTLPLSKFPLKDDTFYNEAQQFPGIQYPTIRNNGIEENYAIKPEAINDGLLMLDKAEYIEVADKADEGYRYILLDIAFELLDSKIMWLNLKNKWIMRDSDENIVFVEDENGVMAYNNEGDIIEPIK